MRFLILAMMALLIPLGACKEERQAEVNEPRIVDEREYDITEGQKYAYSESWQHDNMFRGVDHVYIVYRPIRTEEKLKIPSILHDEVFLPMLQELYIQRYKVDKPSSGFIRHPKSFDLRNQQVSFVNLMDEQERENFKNNIFPDPNNLYVFLHRSTWLKSEQAAPGLNIEDSTTIIVRLSRGPSHIYESMENFQAFPVPHKSVNEDTQRAIKIRLQNMIK